MSSDSSWVALIRRGPKTPLVPTVSSSSVQRSRRRTGNRPFCGHLHGCERPSKLLDNEVKRLHRHRHHHRHHHHHQNKACMITHWQRSSTFKPSKLAIIIWLVQDNIDKLWLLIVQISSSYQYCLVLVNNLSRPSRLRQIRSEAMEKKWERVNGGALSAPPSPASPKTLCLPLGFSKHPRYKGVPSGNLT